MESSGEGRDCKDAPERNPWEEAVLRFRVKAAALDMQWVAVAPTSVDDENDKWLR
jgi:hypothetical protein